MTLKVTKINSSIKLEHRITRIEANILWLRKINWFILGGLIMNLVAAFL